MIYRKPYPTSFFYLGIIFMLLFSASCDDKDDGQPGVIDTYAILNSYSEEVAITFFDSNDTTIVIIPSMIEKVIGIFSSPTPVFTGITPMIPIEYFNVTVVGSTIDTLKHDRSMRACPVKNSPICKNSYEVIIDKVRPDGERERKFLLTIE